MKSESVTLERRLRMWSVCKWRAHTHSGYNMTCQRQNYIFMHPCLKRTSVKKHQTACWPRDNLADRSKLPTFIHSFLLMIQNNKYYQTPARCSVPYGTSVSVLPEPATWAALSVCTCDITQGKWSFKQWVEAAAQSYQSEVVMFHSHALLRFSFPSSIQSCGGHFIV